MGDLSLGQVKSFELGGDFASHEKPKIAERTRQLLSDYAGTLISTAVTLGSAGYALLGNGGFVKRGTALAGSMAGLSVTLGIYDDEYCARDYRQRTEAEEKELSL